MFSTKVEAAAMTLIDCFTTVPVLALTDFNKPFFFTARASDAVVGVMLALQADNFQKHQIVGSHSHRFIPRKQRYHAPGLLCSATECVEVQTLLLQ